MTEWEPRPEWCSHGVQIRRENDGWWFQHGENPEAQRWFATPDNLYALIFEDRDLGAEEWVT